MKTSPVKFDQTVWLRCRSVRRIVLLLLWLWAMVPAQVQGQALTAPVLLEGKVTDENGKGIARVPVTDGTRVVLTNAKGAFRFFADPDAVFIYLTLPAGYQVPQERGVARFYKRIEPHQGKFRCRFRLQRLQQSDTRHYTILWADPQINTPAQASRLVSVSAADTREHARELMQKGPVTGIAAGDIFWDNPAMIPHYQEAVAVSGIPFFQVLGNHDMDLHVRSDEASDSTFRQHFGPTWYSFNRGQAHYVVLDNVFYYSKGYNYIGYITEKQLQWLAQDLATVPAGAPVFVSMHIPGYTHEKRRYQRKEDNLGNVTANRQALYNLLKPFNAHLLTGHSHYNENVQDDQVYEHITAALCGAWWAAPVCDDGTPAGYGVYEVDGFNVKWYYKTVGKPPSHQMRVYAPGAFLERPEYIGVNVWNWDAEWKVEWFEDGKPMGPMTQATGFDALARELMEGPEKPGTYAWIEPRLTDHLFFAKPSSQAREVTIEVHDRFGNRFQETIILKQ